MRPFRAAALAFGVLGILSFAEPVLAKVTVKELKTAMADCYKDRDLRLPDGVIRAADWKGPIVADEETVDAVHLTVGGKTCWCDRSEVVVDAPDVSGCEDKSGGFASRGLGDKKECKQKKSGR